MDPGDLTSARFFFDLVFRICSRSHRENREGQTFQHRYPFTELLSVSRCIVVLFHCPFDDLYAWHTIVEPVASTH